MSDSLKLIKLETLVVDIIYLVSGVIANTWFMTQTKFWDYSSSFIDVFQDSKVIYYVLFFGLSYAIGISLNEIGHTLVVLIFKFMGVLLKFKLLPHQVIKLFFGFISFDSNNAKQLSIDYFGSLKKIRQINDPTFHFMYERSRARALGHEVCFGFCFVNILIYAIYLSQINYKLLFFIVLLCVELCNIMKALNIMSEIESAIKSS